MIHVYMAGNLQAPAVQFDGGQVPLEGASFHQSKLHASSYTLVTRQGCMEKKTSQKSAASAPCFVCLGTIWL